METTNRRDFVKKSTLGLAGLGLTSTATTTQTTIDTKNMFVHHVYFWLKKPESKEDRARLLKGLQTLPKIEAIKMAHIGIPADTNRPVIDTSYQFSLLLVFDNRKDQDVYQNHPVHLQFVKDCSDLWTKVIVYDSVNA
jgi:hypothetical protein